MKKLIAVIIVFCSVSFANAQVQFYVNAQNDASEVATSGSTTIDVVCNDSYLNLDNVVLATSNGNSGLVDNNNDGTITYTNSGNYNDDTLSYTLTNGDSNSTGLVYIVMTSSVPNVAPVVNNDNGSDSGYVAIVVDVLLNDTDTNNDNLTITNVSGGNNGAASFNDDSIIYTPNANWVGLDTLSYTISDGNSGTDSGFVYIQSGTTAQIASYNLLMAYDGVLMTIDSPGGTIKIKSNGTFDQVGGGVGGFTSTPGTWYLLVNGNINISTNGTYSITTPFSNGYNIGSYEYYK